jgi:hypothetical protein
VDLKRARRYGAERNIGPPQLFALVIQVKLLARPGRFKGLSAPKENAVNLEITLAAFRRT